MLLNWQSDYIIRHLRKPGDTRHYLPQKGMYRYVTSANYFGEIVEWAGWAILTCSLSGLVFLWWTIANLVPRANAIWYRYREEFGDAVGVFSGHMLSKAAERIVRFRSVIGPKVTGLKSLDSIVVDILFMSYVSHDKKRP